jgi:hypothetical protein
LPRDVRNRPRQTARAAIDSQGARWAGKDWSEWHRIEDVGIIPAPQEPGIYRLRCASTRGLIYIGESGRTLRKRLRELRRGLRNAAAGMQRDTGHWAAPHIFQVVGKAVVEVSWIALANVDKRERLGIECDLIATYRRQEGSNPTCQFSGKAAAD